MGSVELDTHACSRSENATVKPHAFDTAVSSEEWARLGSNQRPLACEASALPLSYAPGAHYFSHSPVGHCGIEGVCKAFCKVSL